MVLFTLPISRTWVSPSEAVYWNTKITLLLGSDLTPLQGTQSDYSKPHWQSWRFFWQYFYNCFVIYLNSELWCLEDVFLCITGYYYLYGDTVHFKRLNVTCSQSEVHFDFKGESEFSEEFYYIFSLWCSLPSQFCSLVVAINHFSKGLDRFYPLFHTKRIDPQQFTNLRSIKAPNPLFK